MSQSKDVSRSAQMALAIVLGLAFVLTLLLLVSDKNLQTDFGTVKPYYLHWYVMLFSAIADAAGVILLAGLRLRTLRVLGALWCAVMVVLMVADIATYKLVGFSTPSQFAQYLFGLSFYRGALPYIPGLYDALFAVYVAGLIIALAKR